MKLSKLFEKDVEKSVIILFVKGNEIANEAKRQWVLIEYTKIAEKWKILSMEWE